MTNKTVALVASHVIIVFWCSISFAQSTMTTVSSREGSFEITLSSNYVDSKNLSGDQGSSADIQDSWGWGFGFGYHLSEHWQLGFDINWRSSNYDATIVVEDLDNPGNSGPKNFAGRLDTSSTLFSATYNFSNKNFTPYVSGIMGWTFVDTNVPTGPPQNWCWWDPWFGYICSTYIPTRSETDFSYGGSLGLRYDINRSMFLRAAYSMLWVDFKNTGAEDFGAFRMDIGFLMN
jgi:opacity protein-like surface antigen